MKTPSFCVGALWALACAGSVTPSSAAQPGLDLSPIPRPTPITRAPFSGALVVSPEKARALLAPESLRAPTRTPEFNTNTIWSSAEQRIDLRAVPRPFRLLGTVDTEPPAAPPPASPTIFL